MHTWIILQQLPGKAWESLFVTLCSRHHSFTLEFILQFSYLLHNECYRIPANQGGTLVRKSAPGRTGLAFAITPPVVFPASFANFRPQDNGGTIQRACCINACLKGLCYQFLHHSHASTNLQTCQYEVNGFL